MARNVVALTGVQALTVLLDLVFVIVLSRVLGPAAAGKLALAASLWAMGAMVIAAGADQVLAKETARSLPRAGDLLGTAIVLRLGLGLLVAGVLVALAISRYPPDTVALVMLLGVATLLTQVGDASRAVLQGLQQVRALALGSIASKVFRTASGVTLLMLGASVVQVAIVWIGAAVIYTWFPLRDVLRRRMIAARVRIADARLILRSGAPFFATTLFVGAYGQVHVILLSLLGSEAEVGWYNAAGQFFGTLCIVPAMAGSVILPALAPMHVRAPERLPTLIGQILSLTVSVVVPISIGLIMLGEPAVVFVYGPRFAASGPVLALIGVVIAFTYLNTIVASCLAASDRQARVTWAAAASLVATIALDSISIPWSHRVFSNGAIGAVLTYVLTEAAVLVALVRALPRGTLGPAVGARCWRALLAGITMGAAIWPLREVLLIVPVVVGAAVYVGMATALRLLTPDEWRLVVDVCRSIRTGRYIESADPGDAIQSI